MAILHGMGDRDALKGPAPQALRRKRESIIASFDRSEQQGVFSADCAVSTVDADYDADAWNDMRCEVSESLELALFRAGQRSAVYTESHGLETILDALCEDCGAFSIDAVARSLVRLLNATRDYPRFIPLPVDFRFANCDNASNRETIFTAGERGYRAIHWARVPYGIFDVYACETVVADQLPSLVEDDELGKGLAFSTFFAAKEAAMKANTMMRENIRAQVGALAKKFFDKDIEHLIVDGQ